MATTSAPSPVPSHGGSSVMGITIGVGVPVILVIATAVIVLVLILAYLHYRSKHNKIMDGYQSVPTEDLGPYTASVSSESTGSPAPSTRKISSGGTSLPYPVKLTRPARVHIDDPHPPSTFVHATQLSSSSGTGYQFREPQPLSPHDIHRYGQPGKRRSGGKVRLHSGEPTDSSDHESSRPSSGEMYDRRQPSPKPVRKFSMPPSPIEFEDQPKLPEICFQLRYNEKSNRMVIKIERVTYLPCREDGSMVDAYIRLFFIPKLQELPQRKTSKTQTQRGTSPVFDEELTYEAMTPEEVINSTLHVEVLDYRSYGKHQILGLGDLPLIQVKFEGDLASITLPLHLPKAKPNLGTVLLSLCYSPEDKKLSVIILRAKDLNQGNARETDAQAKVWISLGGEKLGRLRTKKKIQSASPIFNEALTATVDPSQMKNISINISLTNENRQALKKELGQVILCGQTSAEEFRHWNDILASPGKQIAEWHELR